jgi:hypothetical protein
MLRRKRADTLVLPDEPIEPTVVWPEGEEAVGVGT